MNNAVTNVTNVTNLLRVICVSERHEGIYIFYIERLCPPLVTRTSVTLSLSDSSTTGKQVTNSYGARTEVGYRQSNCHTSTRRGDFRCADRRPNVEVIRPKPKAHDS